MRPRSVALLAACIALCLCDAKGPAPRCAVDCASNIRNDNGVVDLKTICGDKLMTNSLFQCLITSCPHDTYSPAVAHVILACSDLGIAIGPLYPVEVQHANLVKVQDLLAPSMPAAYGAPSDPSPQIPEQLTLSFDVSIDLKCNSGSDGLVTVSLPIPALPSSTASPSLPSSVPILDPGKGEGDGQGDNGGGVAEGDDANNNGGNDNGTGDNGNGTGDNGNGTGDNGQGGDGDGPSSSSPKPTEASADPSATTSCSPDSASPNAQDPGDVQAPSPSTDGGANGDPAATSVPSGSPDSGDPASPASSPSPASPASSPSPAPPSSPASPASTSPCATASPETGGLDPQDPNQSDPSSASAGEGEEPQAPATSPALPPPSASLTAPASSSSCSAADGTNASVNSVPGPQVSQTAEAPSAAPQLSSQPSPLPSSPATVPASSPSDSSTDPSSGGPSIYSSGADFETSLPEPSTQPLPQENQGPGAQAPSYDQSGSTLRSLTILTDDAAVETAEGQSPSKTSEPSELTLWPTAKANRTSSTTSAAGQHGSPTSSCESDGKETVTTAHTPRVNLVFPSDVSRAAPETVAETLLMTVLNTASSAPAAPTPAISDESVFGSASSNSLAQSAFATTSPTSDGIPVQSGEAAKESSAPKVALVNGVSRATPHLFTIALLIIFVGGMLLN